MSAHHLVLPVQHQPLPGITGSLGKKVVALPVIRPPHLLLGKAGSSRGRDTVRLGKRPARLGVYNLEGK